MFVRLALFAHLLTNASALKLETRRSWKTDAVQNAQEDVEAVFVQFESRDPKFLIQGGVLAWDLDSDSIDISQNQFAQLRVVDDPDYYLHHVRKAGGSTMRRWLDKVCNISEGQQDCSQVTEGSSITEARSTDLFGPNSHIKVALIHLREPVARAQSLVNMNLHDFNKTCQSGMKAHTLGNELEPCQHLTMGSELQKLQDENMYVKSLVGTDRNHPDSHEQDSHEEWKSVDDEDLESAKQQLSKFHGVVISEWLKFPVMAEYLSKHVFHLDQVVEFPHANVAEVKLKFNDEQWATVASQNMYDTKLWEFAKELTLKRMQDAGMSADQLRNITDH